MAMRAHPKAMYGADVTGGSRDVTSKCLICESLKSVLATAHSSVVFSLSFLFFFLICEPKGFKASTAVVPVEWSLPAGI